MADSQAFNSITHLRSIIDSIPAVVVLVDSKGVISLVNKQTEFLFGYSREELLGELVEKLIPKRFKKAHPGFRQSYLEQPTNRPMGKGRDLFGLRKDGTEFPIEIGLNPIETKDDVYIVAAIVDLTERNQTFERLHEANSALEASNIELQQFAYVASHDLQTPLRAICGYSQFLQSDCSEGLDSAGQKYLQRIVENTQRMQSLIQDLLAFSRVETKANPFSKVNMNEVFDETLKMLAFDEVQAPCITKSELPIVYGDRSQLMQLLMNLIGNAIKYRGDSPLKVFVGAQRKEKDWIISVKDNGIGIESKYFTQIFEIFRRLHNKSQYPGTGIGLALARRIVHRHGGEVWVESTPGKGSTFSFNLKSADDDV